MYFNYVKYQELIPSLLIISLVVVMNLGNYLIFMDTVSCIVYSREYTDLEKHKALAEIYPEFYGKIYAQKKARIDALTPEELTRLKTIAAMKSLMKTGEYGYVINKGPLIYTEVLNQKGEVEWVLNEKANDLRKKTFRIVMKRSASRKPAESQLLAKLSAELVANIQAELNKPAAILLSPVSQINETNKVNIQKVLRVLDIVGDRAVLENKCCAALINLGDIETNKPFIKPYGKLSQDDMVNRIYNFFTPIENLLPEQEKKIVNIAKNLMIGSCTMITDQMTFSLIPYNAAILESMRMAKELLAHLSYDKVNTILDDENDEFTGIRSTILCEILDKVRSDVLKKPRKFGTVARSKFVEDICMKIPK